MREKTRTLLVADSGSGLAYELDPWLAEMGYAVRVVGDIKDVLITLQCENVSVLLMDVQLAAGMGYDALSIIKGLCRDMPIIVTTETNNPEQESNIRRKGIFYYHVKSFGLEELMLAITSAMSRSPH